MPFRQGQVSCGKLFCARLFVWAFYERGPHIFGAKAHEWGRLDERARWRGPSWKKLRGSPDLDDYIPPLRVARPWTLRYGQLEWAASTPSTCRSAIHVTGTLGRPDGDLVTLKGPGLVPALDRECSLHAPDDTCETCWTDWFWGVEPWKGVTSRYVKRYGTPPYGCLGAKRHVARDGKLVERPNHVLYSKWEPLLHAYRLTRRDSWRLIAALLRAGSMDVEPGEGLRIAPRKGMTHDKIATILGCSRSAVTKRIKSDLILNLLQKILVWVTQKRKFRPICIGRGDRKPLRLSASPAGSYADSVTTSGCYVCNRPVEQKGDRCCSDRCLDEFLLQAASFREPGERHYHTPTIRRWPRKRRGRRPCEICGQPAKPGWRYCGASCRRKLVSRMHLEPTRYHAGFKLEEQFLKKSHRGKGGGFTYWQWTSESDGSGEPVRKHKRKNEQLADRHLSPRDLRRLIVRNGGKAGAGSVDRTGGWLESLRGRALTGEKRSSAIGAHLDAVDSSEALEMLVGVADGAFNDDWDGKDIRLLPISQEWGREKTKRTQAQRDADDAWGALQSKANWLCGEVFKKAPSQSEIDRLEKECEAKEGEWQELERALHPKTAASLFDMRDVARIWKCSLVEVQQLFEAGLMPETIPLGDLVRWQYESLKKWRYKGLKLFRQRRKEGLAPVASL